MESEHLSLREQKRLATRAAIEDAATALVLDTGIDDVTVDDICTRAHISRRTFFNYVDSKEAAVVGLPPREVGGEDRELLRNWACQTGNVVDAALHLLLTVARSGRIGDAQHSVTVMARRRRIFREYPELAAARLTAFAPLHRALADLVYEYLEHYPAHRRLPDLPLDAEAKAVVAVVVTASNLGMTTWLATPNATIDDLDRECLAAVGRVAELVATEPLSPLTAASSKD